MFPNSLCFQIAIITGIFQMVNHNFMEVNDAAIATAIDQQVGSSCVRYIEERPIMALPYCKVLRALGAILTGCPTGWGNWDILAISVVVRKLLFQGKCTSRLSDRPVGHNGPLWRNWLARSAVSVGLLPEGWWFEPTQGRSIMKYFYLPFAQYTLHSFNCHLMVEQRPVSSAG
jgi:hypothetical protein